MEEDPLVINENGSNFGILRRDEARRLSIDTKEIRELTYLEKATKLPAEGGVNKKKPYLKQSERVDELSSS